jgi:5-methylcytosine-specific restriction protein A
MPTKPATYCNGCGQAVRGSCSRCRAVREHTRPTSHARGYGSKWRKLRNYVLALDPMCSHCKREIATEVDHIKRKADGGTDDTENLQGLCHECHKVKTLRENSKGGGI